MRNWRTTVAGFVSGFLLAWAQGMTVKGALAGAGLATIGMLAKDSNVTGV